MGHEGRKEFDVGLSGQLVYNVLLKVHTHIIRKASQKGIRTWE